MLFVLLSLYLCKIIQYYPPFTFRRTTNSESVLNPSSDRVLVSVSPNISFPKEYTKLSKFSNVNKLLTLSHFYKYLVFNKLLKYIERCLGMNHKIKINPMCRILNFDNDRNLSRLCNLIHS